MFRAMHFAQFVETPSQLQIRLWTSKERMTVGAQIQSGSAHENRHTSSALNLFNYECCFTRPVSRCVIDVGGYKIDQMVWNATTLGEGHFSCRDLNALIDLHGI